MRTALWRSLSLLLLLTAVVCLVRWGDQSSPGPVDAATPAHARLATDPVGPTGVGAAEPSETRTTRNAPARPISLHIPAIGVDTKLASLGLNADGTVEVPADPEVAGWYRLGTRPGAVGSSVILGHVDSVDGPAVFYRLRTLVAGDLVAVRLADGTTARFQVHSVRVYANDQFPAREVYAATGGHVLNLVTCGGQYDSARGGYQANVVVNARRAPRLQVRS